MVAERMATVGRLSLKVAHEVRNPIAAIELNAELLRRHRAGAPRATDMDEAGGARRGHPRPGERARRAHRGVPGLRALPAAAVRGGLGQRHGAARSRSSSVRSPPARASTVNVADGPAVPPMEIDRTLLRQAVLNLVKNGMEALSQGGALTLASRCDRRRAWRSGSRTPAAASRPRSGGGCSSSSSPPSRRARGSACPSPGRSSRSTAASSAGSSAPGAGATFTIRCPIKGREHG